MVMLQFQNLKLEKWKGEIQFDKESGRELSICILWWKHAYHVQVFRTMSEILNWDDGR